MGLIQTDRATQPERPLGEQEKKLLVDNAHQRFQNSNAFAINIKSVVSQRFSEERELLRLKFRMFVRLGWCK
jgi:hypothetical protein